MPLESLCWIVFLSLVDQDVTGFAGSTTRPLPGKAQWAQTPFPILQTRCPGGFNRAPFISRSIV